jgi:hypothetical protein
MSRNLKYWLRWILLYPSAITAILLIGLLLTVIINIIPEEVETIYPMRGDSYPKDILILLSPFITSLTFILVVYKVAPEFKKITLIFSAVLWILFMCFFVLVLDPFQIVFKLNNNYIQLIPSIGGILIGLIFKIRNEKVYFDEKL